MRWLLHVMLSYVKLCYIVVVVVVAYTVYFVLCYIVLCCLFVMLCCVVFHWSLSTEVDKVKLKENYVTRKLQYMYVKKLHCTMYIMVCYACYAMLIILL